MNSIAHALSCNLIVAIAIGISIIYANTMDITDVPLDITDVPLFCMALYSVIYNKLWLNLPY